MKVDKKTSQWALEIVARVWSDKPCENREMDVVLAQHFAVRLEPVLQALLDIENTPHGIKFHGEMITADQATDYMQERAGLALQTMREVY